MPTNNHIDYIEFPLVDKDKTMAFYAKVFGWKFTEWGPGYISFENAGIDGGFNGVDDVKPVAPGILPVLYAKDLPAKLAEIEAAGGKILQQIYEFPGGKRFHFEDPNGIELAVWTE